MKLSFVVPCYNEEKNIKLFYNDVLDSFKNSKYRIELVFINDGSKDKTLDELKKLLINKEFSIKIINFSRNFGKEAAIYSGLKEATGDYIVLIDADMQQPPHFVLDMLKVMEEKQNIDVVAYYQEKRIESKVLSFFKSNFYKIINKITGMPFVNGASDFRLLKRNVVDAVLSLPEHNRFSKGIFAWIGFETYYLPYIPEKRAHGKTSWRFKDLLDYALSGILSFSKHPLNIITKLGFINVFISITWLIILLINNSSNYIEYLFPFIIFMFGLNFVVLGYIGEFIARNYSEVRNRPIYIAKEVLTNEKNN